uniref:Putative secreted protein n=1 Tax=Anopheles marajoara TaxID=58244 RepID=A0A2M4CFA8_9DIPT
MFSHILLLLLGPSLVPVVPRFSEVLLQREHTSTDQPKTNSKKRDHHHHAKKEERGRARKEGRAAVEE